MKRVVAGRCAYGKGSTHMALSSMTGFGRGKASSNGMRVEVELSSVNRKQFDVRVSLPRPLLTLESRIHELIHGKISRGCVTATVRITVCPEAAHGNVRVNTEAARAYIRQLRKAAAEQGLEDDLTAASLLQLPSVLGYEDRTEDTERVWQLLRRGLETALRGLLRMRAREGKALQADLDLRIHGLREPYEDIRRHAPAVVERYCRSLRSRMTKMGLSLDSNDPVVVKEVALFADRSDISEEIVRLDSHMKQAIRLLKSSKPVGRTLDFLCQEMFREINTIGSKANDVGISRQVIRFKAELESIREQIQNVE